MATPRTDTPTGHAYYPALDGLRAIAVFAVVLFHSRVGVRGGWLGVDLFMALSGWLVSSTLYEALRRNEAPTYLGYLARRARRLMPAVFVTIAGVSVLHLLGMVELERDAVTGALTWSSNWIQRAGPHGYWAAVGAPSPLEHLWSLAIEEQFYVVWPFVVLVATRRLGGAIAARVSTIRVVAVAGAAASLLVGMIGARAGWSVDALYLDTRVRAFPFLVGAAAAGCTRLSRRLVVNHVLGVLAFAVVSWQMVDMDSTATMFTGRLQLVELACAAGVVYVAGLGRGVVVARPMRAIGRRSYGIYLFHWPIVVALRTNTDVRGWWLAAITTAISVPLAAVSYRWVEQPFRRVAPGPAVHRVRPTLMAIPALTVIAVVAFVAASPVVSRPNDATVLSLPARVAPTAGRAAIGMAGLPRRSEVSTTTTQAPREAAPTAAESTTTVAAVPVTSTLPPLPAVPSVTVAGDSTAMGLSDALEAWAQANPGRIVTGRAAGPGCGLSAATDGRLHDFWGYDDTWDQYDVSACTTGVWEPLMMALADVTLRPDVLVVLVTPWDVVDISFPDGRAESILTADGRAMITAAYERLVDRATSVGTRVVFIEPAPADPGWHGRDLTDPARWAALRELHRELAASNPLVSVLDQEAWFSSNGLAGAASRADGVHLNPDVALRFVAESLMPFIEAETYGP